MVYPMDDSRAARNFPGWDDAWGVSPRIVIRTDDQDYAVALLRELGYLSAAAQRSEADALRCQLKQLSGVTISFVPAGENEARPAVDSRHFGLMPPYIEFNPYLWERYPAEGSEQLSEGGWHWRGFVIPPLEKLDAAYSSYGIASPEQLLLRELGQYAEFYRAYRKFSEAGLRFSDEDLVKEAKAINLVASNETDAILRYEDTPMLSVTPRYIAHSIEDASDIKHLLAQKNGSPDVPESQRNALNVALHMRTAAAEEIGVDESSSSLDSCLNGFPERFDRLLTQAGFSSDQQSLIRHFVECSFDGLNKEVSPHECSIAAER